MRFIPTVIVAALVSVTHSCDGSLDAPLATNVETANAALAGLWEWEGDGTSDETRGGILILQIDTHRQLFQTVTLEMPDDSSRREDYFLLADHFSAGGRDFLQLRLLGTLKADVFTEETSSYHYYAYDVTDNSLTLRSINWDSLFAFIPAPEPPDLYALLSAYANDPDIVEIENSIVLCRIPEAEK